MNRRMTADERPSSGHTQPIALAIAAVRRNIPGGNNAAISGALDTLTQLGDAAALAEVEAWLGSQPLWEHYGDRDDDPPDWHLDPKVFEALARWWERVGLTQTRSAQLVADWLGASRHFGLNGYAFFTATAPELATYVVPLLLAALQGADVDRRRVVDGLGYVPTPTVVAALIALLGDPDEPVRSAARWALNRSAGRREVAEQIVDALGAPMPLVRAGALQALAWFPGLAHRHSIKLPVLFERALAAIVPLLADPDPAVQKLAAERINAAGYLLDMFRPSWERALEQSLTIPPLDMLPLLEHGDPLVVRAALSLAGRCGEAGNPAHQAALADRIIALLPSLQGDYTSYKAAFYALGRLRAVAAIPAIAPHLDNRKGGYYVDAALVLGRLGYTPAIEHLVGLLTDLTYDYDALEALEALDPASVLSHVIAQVSEAWRLRVRYAAPRPAEARYLEERGDAHALALLRQTENYHFAARHAGANDDPLVVAVQRLERRLLLEGGADPQSIDDPVATVRRILGGPVHPAECVTRNVSNLELPYGEQRARWRNLCVALAEWLRADPPPALDAALDEAERLLVDFPDEVREAHEAWWLDLVRHNHIIYGTLRSSVGRVTLRPREPWRLARALLPTTSLDPAICFGWPGLARIMVLELPFDLSWIQALAQAPPHVAPRRLRVQLSGDLMALALAEWPGLERLEELEVMWNYGLSKHAQPSWAQHLELLHFLSAICDSCMRRGMCAISISWLLRRITVSRLLQWVGLIRSPGRASSSRSAPRRISAGKD
jgi:HEAT repeat protein